MLMMLVVTDMLQIMLVVIDTLLIMLVSIDMLLIMLVNIDMQLIMLLITYMLLIMLAKITVVADAYSSSQNGLDSACSNTTEMVWVAGVGKGRTVQPFLCTSSSARSVLPSGLRCTLDQHSEAKSPLVKPRFMQLCCKGAIVLQAICYN